MKANKVTKWMKEHKKELAIGAVVVVGGVILSYFGVKWVSKSKVKVSDDILPLPDSSLLGIDKRYGVDLEPIPMEDLGKLGEEFQKAMPELDPSTPVNVVAYVDVADELRK